MKLNTLVGIRGRIHSLLYINICNQQKQQGSRIDVCAFLLFFVNFSIRGITRIRFLSEPRITRITRNFADKIPV